MKTNKWTTKQKHVRKNPTLQLITTWARPTSKIATNAYVKNDTIKNERIRSSKFLARLPTALL